MAIQLIVRAPFSVYSRGAVISDAAVSDQILAGPYSDQVARIDDAAGGGAAIGGGGGGAAVVGAYIDGNGHTIVLLSSGASVDVGILVGGGSVQLPALTFFDGTPATFVDGTVIQFSH